MNKFEICSNALVMVGGAPITAFDGSSAEAIASAQFWDTTIENWISLYDWRHLMKQAQMSRLLAAPEANWDAAYDLPSDCVTLKRVTVNDHDIDYDRFERMVYCDATADQEVYADYIYNTDPENWPPYFVTLIELSLARKFSFSLGAKLDLRETIKEDIERQFARAKNRDSIQQTTKSLPVRGRKTIMERRLS